MESYGQLCLLFEFFFEFFGLFELTHLTLLVADL